jgi:alanine-glyoxylate transaminase/serine-glyoxylate transaminase/serine-pyruvate transaminase
MVYALYQALLLILEEGPVQVFKRHRDTHQMLVKGLEGMGLKMVVEKPRRLPMLNTVYCPEGIDELVARRRLRSEYKIEIGGGLGPLAGKIWRIGLMGHTARKENVERFLDSLRKVIS